MECPVPDSLFDAAAEAYDRARPSYPDALFDDLETYAGSIGRREVIEVGPATGQATRSLLARGGHVTAVELGPSLAAFLATKYADEPRLTVVNAAFEDAPLPEASADLVFSATAYHWVNAAVRMSRPHALLRPGGVLAVVDTNQVHDDAADRRYFERSQPLYARYWPDQTTYRPGPEPQDVVPPIYEEMRASGLFEDLRLWRYRWDQRYDVNAYMDLVLSYSNTWQLAPDAREAFLRDLRTFVAAEEGSYVLRPLVITLVVGRKA